MRPVTLLVVVLAAGCAKKAEPYQRQYDDSGAKAGQPAEPPKAEPSRKPDAAEKPTWIRPRKADGDQVAEGVSGKPAPWVDGPPPQGDVRPPAAGNDPVAPPGPAVVLQPAAPAQPPARPATGTPATPGKVVTRADLNEVWVFVENFSQANGGKMPRPELVYAALADTKAAAAELVKSNDIILTGKAARESVWAYERKAPAQGGWIAGHNGPEEVTATEFARRIRQ